MASKNCQKQNFRFLRTILKSDVISQNADICSFLINNWWKFQVEIFSLSRVMSYSILLPFAWRLIGFWDVGLRECKYLKNDSY